MSHPYHWLVIFYQSNNGIILIYNILECVDALGKPVRLLITTGQASEYGQVNKLPENLDYQYLLADKEYDSDEIIALVT